MIPAGPAPLQRWGLPAALGVVLAFALYALVLHPEQGFPRTMDYTGWYAAAHIVLDGRTADLYNLAVQAEYQRPIFEEAGVAIYGDALVFNRAPFYLLPFLLLAQLPFIASYALWAVTVLAEGALAVYLLVNHVYPARADRGAADRGAADRGALFTTAIVMLAFWPVFQGILLGQTSLLELLGLTGFYLLLRGKREFAAGAVLGLLAFKPQLVLFFLLPLIIGGSWRGLAGFAAVGAVLVAISVALAGVNGLWQYVALTAQNYGWNCIYGVYVDMHQSWRGLFTGLMVTPCQKAGEAPEIFTAPALAQAGLYANVFSAITVALAALVLWRWRHAEPGTPPYDLAFAVLVLTSQLASPYSFPQDLTRVVLAGALLLRSARAAPGLLPGWLEPRRVIALALALGPFATVQIAQRIHPLVWLMIAVFAGLCVVLLQPGRAQNTRASVPS